MITIWADRKALIRRIAIGVAGLTAVLTGLDSRLAAADRAAGNFATDQRQNVLLIIVDDLGFGDLSCQGASDLQTPHIDQLFADSLRLDQFYANCPVCSPTRASVLTGCYPDRVGVPGVIRTAQENSWGYFQPRSRTLPQRLQEAGYRTAAIGKWHLGLRPENHPLEHGFDSFKGFLGDMMDDYMTHRRHNINYMRQGTETIDPAGHATDLFTQWAVDFISEHKSIGNPDATAKQPTAADTAQPWFLYLAYNAPHTPIQPPEDWLRKVHQREDGISKKRAALVALIEHLDAGVGQVLQSLRSTGQSENTTIVFTSDNGGQLGVGANNGNLRDGKGSMYEGGLRIPAALHIPGRTTPGSSTDAIASTVDWLPTLIELASEGNAGQGGQLDGRSLLPLADDPETTWPEREVYFVRREGGTRYGGLTIQAIRLGDYKLVHNLPTQEFELFNLAADPGETENLARVQPKVFRELLGRLQLHVQQGGEIAWQKSDGL